MGPCTHHFCLPCLLKWCEFGGTQCPTCKALLTEIKYDREFDNLVSIINQENTEKYEYISKYLPRDSDVTISFPKDDSKVGITIHNNYDWFGIGKRGPG